jgi:hypothetical protein
MEKYIIRLFILKIIYDIFQINPRTHISLRRSHILPTNGVTRQIKINLNK